MWGLIYSELSNELGSELSHSFSHLGFRHPSTRTRTDTYSVTAVKPM